MVYREPLPTMVYRGASYPHMVDRHPTRTWLIGTLPAHGVQATDPHMDECPDPHMDECPDPHMERLTPE